MTFNFKKTEKEFETGDLVASSDSGYKYLLIQSLGRKDNLVFAAKDIENDANNSIGNLMSAKITANELKQRLFEENEVDIDMLESIILKIHHKQIQERKKHKNKIVKELKKLTSYNWGGLYQNSLQQTIVNNYVKKIENFAELEKKIKSEIYPKSRAYTLFSWYNNWSSIFIEDVFKKHDRVIPVVGKIKQMDFFIDRVPFDLKVTYLPEGYVDKRLREMEKESEINQLSKFCKNHQIELKVNLKIRDYWKAVNSCDSDEAKKFISELNNDRESIVEYVRSNPKDLMEWLYENQGYSRFDSSNRIYLVLYDITNYYDSWKLKSNLEFISENIESFIDSFSLDDSDTIEFKYRNKHYKTVAKMIFLTYPNG